jgi:hypothetical protein
MPIYNMSVKFSVVHEKQLHDIEADSEFDALTEAWQNEEDVIEKLVDQYGKNLVVESVEFIANPAGEPENKTTM